MVTGDGIEETTLDSTLTVVSGEAQTVNLAVGVLLGNLDIDGDLAVDLGTDGFILLRYLLGLGFIPDLLVDGIAFAPAAVRTSGAEVRAFLDAAVASGGLDVDLDPGGAVSLEVEGFIMLRYLLGLGFIPALLTDGIVFPDGATQTDAIAIKAVLDALVPPAPSLFV